MPISDRVMLGAVAGLGGNLVKNTIMDIMQRLNLAEFGVPARAAGILVPGYKIGQRKGKAVGFLADNIMALTLGTGITYLLTFSGSDRSVVKGTFAGAMLWAALYGAAFQLGATKIDQVPAETALCELVAHIGFGATAAAIASGLGDPRLFQGTLRLGDEREI